MARHRIPLLHDHHSHPSIYSAMGECLDLSDVPTLEEACRRISSGGRGFQFVLGWSSSRYNFSRQDLERLPPVFILHLSLHHFVLNSEGRRRLRQTHPEIVNHAEDPAWIERNLPSILKMFVEVLPSDVPSLTRYYSRLAGQGIWQIQEMLLPGGEMLDALERAGLSARTPCWADPAVFQSLGLAAQKRVEGIKLFSDGALAAHTAALESPYLGGGRGLLLRSDGEFLELLFEISGWKKPLAVHTIGGRAVRQLLDCLERLEAQARSFPSIRLEHCQFISSRDAARAHERGVVLSMQPNFSVDSEIYRDRLDEDHVASNNPFRMLIDDAGFEPGRDLILGSDGMPHGVQFALESALFPPQPGQRLELDEFVAGYCLADRGPGEIEVEIDLPARTVRTAVRLSSKAECSGHGP